MVSSPTPTVQAPSGDLLTPTATPMPPWSQLMLSGALVQISREASASKTIVPFQYNPESLTRTLKPSYYQSRKDMLTGPAAQSISLKVQVEASSGMWNTPVGILPQLSALEVMVNPSSTALTQYETDLASNKLSAVPPPAPRILFIWGPSRVLPVLISSMTIKETMFNSLLVPVLADVDLALEVAPFPQTTGADTSYLIANVSNLETFAAINIAYSLSSIALIGVNPLGIT